MSCDNPFVFKKKDLSPEKWLWLPSSRTFVQFNIILSAGRRNPSVLGRTITLRSIAVESSSLTSFVVSRTPLKNVLSGT